ncbi:MAG: helix-turn-helix domain-containing protein [Candidatus Tectomicrobia bacterium]|uniref:Helix-turn-helix domain-containing protein n=1 Tax=Tectimicrobiota bacterium TaxID=2528274 RepID=A0A932CP90_UNCTE|nr:helix-turn-helix domain-containing protein [Candidatus Tectomicrobia bacterium]
MSKAGESIIAGLKDAIAYAQGDLSRGWVHFVQGPDVIDVKAIRKRLGLTQVEFARRFGFELGSVRNWEQGRRRPEGPARVLLKVIEKEPEAVQRALTA